MLKALAVAATAMVCWSGAAMAEGDAAAGEKVFRKCKACHVADEETNRVGPHLVGIVGRAAGGVDGFNYSDAITGSGLTWDEANLAQYLANPKEFLPGNKMAFPGLRKEADVANIVAYLKSL